MLSDGDGNWICLHAVTYIFLLPCCIFHSADTWQLQLIHHGNCSCCHMATTMHCTWQLELPAHGNSLLSMPTFHISATFIFKLDLFCFSRYPNPLFLSLQPPLRRLRRHLMKLTAGLRRQHCRGGPHEVRANQVPTRLLSRYLRIPLEVPPLVL